jgi:hypothetical protein
LFPSLASLRAAEVHRQSLPLQRCCIEADATLFARRTSVPLVAA